MTNLNKLNEVAEEFNAARKQKHNKKHTRRSFWVWNMESSAYCMAVWSMCRRNKKWGVEPQASYGEGFP